MSKLITIEQLLESVDLSFKPRWVTKNKNGGVYIWEEKPTYKSGIWMSESESMDSFIAHLKLAEFEGKCSGECIYEVPKEPTDQIEKLDEHAGNMQLSSASMTRNQFVANTIMKKINEIIDKINKIDIINTEEKKK